jgi:hypothetical protein
MAGIAAVPPMMTIFMLYPPLAMTGDPEWVQMQVRKDVGSPVGIRPELPQSCGLWGRPRAVRSGGFPPFAYSAAAGCAAAHSSGSSSSLRFGKKSAQPSVTTQKIASTVVTAATLPVRS